MFSGILWIIFVPGFLFIANCTGAKNRAADMTDYRLRVRYEEPRSISSREAKATGITRRRRYLDADLSSVPKLRAKFMNDNNVGLNTTGTNGLTNARNNSTPILRPLDFGKASKRSDHSSLDIEDQSVNQFATVSPSAKEMLSISSDSFTGTRAMPSTTSRVTNHSNSGNEITRGSLTLMDINGPVISQDAESLQYDGSMNSEHIRVKRDKLGGIHDEVSPDETTNSTAQMVREKRLNYEMLFPRSDSKSKYETEEQSKELSDEMEYSGPKYISSSPVFLESFPRSGNSLEARKSEIPGELGRDVSGLSDPATNLTTAWIDAGSNVGKRYSKRRKKRYAQLRGRARRRGGPRGERRKLRHRRKHRKKPKNPKKPGAKTHEERSAAEIEETTRDNSNLISKFHAASHLVDELQVEAHVEKRDSGDAKSEIDVKKREISGDDGVNIGNRLSREKRTVENIGNSTVIEKETPASKNACEDKELRYYDDVHEPDLRTRRRYIGTKPDLVDKTGKQRAAESFRQVKKLMEKLAGKVDELGTFVSHDSQERKRGIGEKKKVVVGDVPDSAIGGEGADFRNLTKDCSGEFEAESKSGVEKIGGGDEAKKRAAVAQRDRKRSAGISRRRKACRKNRIKKRKSHKKWDKWTDWSSCSVTCGKGRQIRWRHCIHDCTSAETEMEEKSCQLPACGPGKFLGIF